MGKDMKYSVTSVAVNTTCNPAYTQRKDHGSFSNLKRAVDRGNA